MIKFSFALYSILLISTTNAAEITQLIFSHFDWEIVCDNFGTCRAAGFQTEDQDDQHHYLGARGHADRRPGAR